VGDGIDLGAPHFNRACGASCALVGGMIEHEHFQLGQCKQVLRCAQDDNFNIKG
jgi:hypothetical protein